MPYAVLRIHHALLYDIFCVRARRFAVVLLIVARLLLLSVTAWNLAVNMGHCFVPGLVIIVIS